MKTAFAALALLPALAICAEVPKNLTSAPLRPASKPAGQTLFTRLDPTETGIDVTNKMNVDHPMSYLYHSGMTTGGVAIADFDGDGKPDIFFAGTTSKNRLYRQTGDLKFEDITAISGAGLDGGELWTTGASVVDANGDGRLDLYLCN